ncbi:8-oxo-dGTP diphosphatase [Fodinisporobacter ferrooxydans]|uniref:8-oxo-dGTP diphosphatase n=1 Tax=Fodinisporobacter ferrooxydans TaxID=2901836 RepID=A0ABY4CTX2_9BACL|nr:8-oxo-dGTP diphosphatase [Alicyclobacillaceae bacterium MYW30-H2]
MQLIANCVLESKDKVLILQKPRRGWWVAPGGKVERGESLYQAVIREFQEETGLQPQAPRLRCVFTVMIYDGDTLIDHWMMFSFHSIQATGTLLPETREGVLQWISKDDVLTLPMAGGDRYMFEYILMKNDPSVLHGTFHYTKDMELIKWEPEPDISAIP